MPDEVILESTIPRAEVLGWRERYGVVAGITRKPYDLGLWTGEPVEGVMGRWREFRRAEAGFTQYVLGTQVHGNRVEIHSGFPRDRRGGNREGGKGGRRSGDVAPPGEQWKMVDGVDGHVAAGFGVMLNVTVADCTPIYLVHPPTKTVALLHAGWRGTAAGILERGVQSLLVAAQGIPGDATEGGVVCHLGVSICGECYEVGPEVFEAMGLPVPKTNGGKGKMDVRSVLAHQARALGIKNVTVSSHCTRHGEGWYSHRGGDRGRMVAYLGVVG
jgi:copper oxidase (laccase) domain-containing protein